MNNAPLCPQPCSSKCNINAITIIGTRMVELSRNLNILDYMTENECKELAVQWFIATV